MLLLAAIFFSAVASIARDGRKTATAPQKRLPQQPDCYDAPTLPLHRTTGLAGR